MKCDRIKQINLMRVINMCSKKLSIPCINKCWLLEFVQKNGLAQKFFSHFWLNTLDVAIRCSKISDICNSNKKSRLKYTWSAE